jgi:transposase, IS5 family
MSICDSGMKNKVFGANVTTKIDDLHPLVKLANFICWATLFDMVLPDLKASTKRGKWWLGRKLKVRVHLAIYILQQMFNKTDRQIEYDVKDNAAYQIFCGLGIVDKWLLPQVTQGLQIAVISI